MNLNTIFFGFNCSEDSTVCVPVERYCDRVADCPDGSDEADCSCEDWDMYGYRLEGIIMCIYKHWIQNISVDLLIDEISDVVIEQRWQLFKYQGLSLTSFAFFLSLHYSDCISHPSDFVPYQNYG